MLTKRKPWIHSMPRNWWQQLGFYRFYMLREGTAIPALWFSIELIFGLYALKNGAESWTAFVGFLQHPVVLVLNIVALLAALLHSKTWFDLAPKAAIIVIKGEKMGPAPVVIALWLVMLLFTLAIVAIALFA
ncbi:fumarate reductase subunit C [Erwinia toletana]|uniref:Fumarate reductase subunit C n=1 Tax=Winslowiella toletana TaxID=92490 RepID=A0ABS4PA50_9GAMM|nr:fumarate reductase subunit FrdC [Winslowiella toletana]MBP2169482.1 fumarate reductase subunit C [Winslowiella toletana]